MRNSLEIEGPLLGKGQVCESVIRDLPDWFGIEEANRNYIEKADKLPTFVAKIDSEPVGFMSLLIHSPQSAELYVFGVLRDFHRQGIGRKLLHASESWLKEQGVQFVQAKTLAAEAEDKNFEKTRQFYESADYVPLEVFPDLWDPHNPCLQMIKSI